jgi:hypothetical protein
VKILKTKSTTLSDNLFLCQDSKGSTVQFEFNIFCTFVTCHGNGQNAKKKNEKHKNYHSRLLAKQKLMKLVRNNIHIYWNKINQKNSAHLLIVLNIPVKFHWFPFSSRREMCWINFWRKKERCLGDIINNASILSKYKKYCGNKS